MYFVYLDIGNHINLKIKDMKINELQKGMEAIVTDQITYFHHPTISPPISGKIKFESIEKDIEGYIYVTLEGRSTGIRSLVPYTCIIEGLLDKDKWFKKK